MSFSIYLVGFIVVIAGIAWGMTTAGVSTTWVLITSVILLGTGIVTAATRTRNKDVAK